MEATSKRAIKAMVKALERFSQAQVGIADHDWIDLCGYVGIEGDLPTWRDVDALRESLEAYLEEDGG